MTGLRIAHETRVLVADGRKALVLRNEGDELYPNLQVERLLEAPPNPPTRDQGTDAPGRAMMGGRRSAVDQTDWHAQAERAFVHDVAAMVAELCRREKVAGLVVVAPPRALADLRETLPEAVRRLVIAEVDKDLTKHPVHEIERHLT
jgi:protein required for attachment to host cells